MFLWRDRLGHGERWSEGVVFVFASPVPWGLRQNSRVIQGVAALPAAMRFWYGCAVLCGIWPGRGMGMAVLFHGLAQESD